MGKKSQFNIDGNIWIMKGDELFIGPIQYQLFKQVIKDGSLRSASRNLNISYQHAWNILNKMNHISPLPLIISYKGGSDGGGYQVTKFGIEVIELIQKKEVQLNKFLNDLNSNFDLCSF